MKGDKRSYKGYLAVRNRWPKIEEGDHKGENKGLTREELGDLIGIPVPEKHTEPGWSHHVSQFSGERFFINDEALRRRNGFRIQYAGQGVWIKLEGSHLIRRHPFDRLKKIEVSMSNLRVLVGKYEKIKRISENDQALMGLLGEALVEQYNTQRQLILLCAEDFDDEEIKDRLITMFPEDIE